jgi:hypothetical protein
MTPDERKMLEDLAAKFAQTPAPPRDPEAEDLIRTKIGSRPDALYLMTQTVLIQNLALQHAQQQIQELQQRTTQPVPAGAGGSFLGGPGAARGGYSQPAQQYGGQQYAAPPPPPQYAAPSPSMPSPSGAPSFLRGAAQTAAGVAAGALAFEGIQSLFSHPGYGGGFGGFGGGAGFGGAPREEIIENNYYDTPQQQDASGDRADYNDQGQNVDDQGQYEDNNAQLDNADYDTGGDDGGSFDDNSGGDNFA